MANNPVIKGDNTVLFGIAGVSSITGILQSCEVALEGDKLEIQDENGFVVAVIYFNDKKQITFEMIVKTAAPPLDRGDEITVAGVIGALVESTREMWKKDDVRKLQVTATWYSGLEL